MPATERRAVSAVGEVMDITALAVTIVTTG
jgi:hypothetical protein